MLTQNRIGQGKIGFEFANAGLIDQGRQRIISMLHAVCSEFKVIENGLWQIAKERKI
jgi:hypothetical protein